MRQKIFNTISCFSICLLLTDNYNKHTEIKKLRTENQRMSYFLK
jgi:hypothetical protein